MTHGHPLEGTSVGIYEVRTRIGRGGMGEVYLARDTRLGRPVALKVLPERFALDERFRERLLRESRLAASLDHPNVVPVYDAGEADGRLFIAMRYVDGVDLKALLRDAAPLAPERVMDIAGQLAEALDAAHQRGLVHRDVKPGNVLLDQQGDRDHAYLADFGLTQTPAAAGPADGQFMGTVDYVAPEQIRGDVVDGRADQYALGCLLFECLTGSLPFRDRSEVAAIFAHLEEPPPLASERHEALPPAVDAVLARAMAKEPAQRFDSCRELVAATHDALGLAAAAARGAGAGSCRCSPLRSLYPLSPPWRSASAAGRRRALRGRTGRSRRSIRGRTASAVQRACRAIRRRSHRPPAGFGWATSARGCCGAMTRARGSCSGSRPTASRATSQRSAIRCMWRWTTICRLDRSRVMTPLAASGLTVSALLACALASGDGVVWAAGCPFVDRLSTDAQRLRRLRHVLLPFQPPGTASTSRVQFRETGGRRRLAVGPW